MSFGATFGAAPAVSQDFAVNSPPSDSVSALSWSPSNDLLAVSSWDGKVRARRSARAAAQRCCSQVRIYQAQGATANGVALFDQGTSGAPPGTASSPVLDVTWTRDGSKVLRCARRCRS
jgi:mRNA export factor